MTYRDAARLIDRMVRTPNGVGLLLNKETPSNGLYFERERTQWLVWFGTEHPSRGHWIQTTYHHNELERVRPAEAVAFLESLPDKLREQYISVNTEV